MLVVRSPLQQLNKMCTATKCAPHIQDTTSIMKLHYTHPCSLPNYKLFTFVAFLLWKIDVMRGASTICCLTRAVTYIETTIYLRRNTQTQCGTIEIARASKILLRFGKHCTVEKQNKNGSNSVITNQTEQ